MAQADRIKFISLLQIIGVSAVVLYHSLHEYPGNWDATLYNRLFVSIRMPLFVFISGYLFNFSRLKSGRLKPYKDFFTGKIQRLIVPFLFLSIITFVPRVMLSGMADDAIELSFKSFFGSLLFSDQYVIIFFWFLPAIFILLNLVYGSLALFKREEVAYAILFILGLIFFFLSPFDNLTFLAFGKVLSYFLFFVSGVIYVRYHEKLDKILGNWFALILSMLLWLGSIYIPSDAAIFSLTARLFGLSMVVSFSLLFCNKCGWLMHLEGYTYIIYLLSWYTCTLSQQVLAHFTDFDWWVYTLLAFFSSIYIPRGIAWLLYSKAPSMKSARALLWLLGHNPKRSLK